MAGLGHGGWGTSRHKKDNTCGHPERRHYARNMCARCYANRPEYADHRRRYYEANKARYKRHDEASRARKVRQKLLYGIAPEEWHRMNEAQGGLCAICKRPPGRKSLGVDHCHTTGRVRALLCAPCNMAIGAFRDNADWCRKAAEYLDRHAAL